MAPLDLLFKSDSSGGGSASGAGTLSWFLSDNAIPPTEGETLGISYFEFDYQQQQSVYAMFKLPGSYTSGKALYMQGGLYATGASAGNVFMRTQTWLIRPDSTPLTALTYNQTSLEAQLSVSTPINTIRNLSTFTISSTNGQISGQTLLAGDMLLIRMYRDIAGESSSATDYSRVFKNTFFVGIAQ